MTIAAIQMCSSTNVDDNIFNAENLIAESANKGAKVIVLPEMFATMISRDKPIDGVKEVFGKGKIQSFLSQQAKKYNVYIVGGTIPIATNTNKVTSTCLVLDNKGIVIARYDKIHLFDVKISDNESYSESDTIENGSELTVVDTPVGKLGLIVCYDVRFQDQCRKLVNLGAEIITVPAAFTVPTGKSHWELLLRSRAIDNLCYVVGAAQSGNHENGRNTYGHSMIVNPWGEILVEKKDPGQGIIFTTIDLPYLYKIRTNFPVLKY